jgi:hypothetical protein
VSEAWKERILMLKSGENICTGCKVECLQIVNLKFRKFFKL